MELPGGGGVVAVLEGVGTLGWGTAAKAAARFFSTPDSFTTEAAMSENKS